MKRRDVIEVTLHRLSWSPATQMARIAEKLLVHLWASWRKLLNQFLRSTSTVREGYARDERIVRVRLSLSGVWAPDNGPDNAKISSFSKLVSTDRQSQNKVYTTISSTFCVGSISGRNFMAPREREDYAVRGFCEQKEEFMLRFWVVRHYEVITP